MTESFTAKARRDGPGAVIDLAGLLDRSAEAQLTAAWAEVADGGGPIVLNFGSVTYINSTGIALVVGLLARARTAARPVRAYGLTDHYRHIFEITRLSDFMGIYDTEGSAIAD